ncbi:MAG: DUF5309 domain-containing protein [Muribaculaceae bacterium]|nr:DUF5309 domain-containing protein [Muribaculaceae bacterium]
MIDTQNQNTAIIPGTTGGSHVIDGPLTTSAVREGSPALLRSDIDSRIVRVRPMSTPVDQISRMIGARPARSMQVEYYTVDSKPVEAFVTEAPTDAHTTYSERKVFVLATDNDDMFARTETLLVPDFNGTAKAPTKGGSLVLYVVESSREGGELKVVVLNYDGNAADGGIPPIEPDSVVVRMGRGASELDVQTPQFEALPAKAMNYCQIFKAQVEQSTYTKLASKEVGWTLSDQEEVAIMDMRMGMEKSFLFGFRSRLVDPKNFDEVLLTRGIWNQAGKEVKVSMTGFGQDTVIDIMRAAFTGEAAGSPRKIMIAGSSMIQAINKLEYTKIINATDTVTRWGIDFNELRSKFGSLYVIHSEIFDQCGHSSDALIIDPQYLTKYTHVPFKVERLDLKKSGLRNTDAIVATEASCMVLRHPMAHIKVVGS